MHKSRELLLSLLERYQSIDPIDGAQAKRIKKFTLENADCFDRTNISGHITGSAWLVNPTGKKVLLTHHKKLGLWLQLGGHSDGNPNPLEVALREAREESGLPHIVPISPHIFDVDVHSIPRHGAETAHLHYDIRFAFTCKAEEPLKLSDESHELRWVLIDKIEKITREQSILRMKKKWNDRGRNPYSLSGGS